MGQVRGEYEVKDPTMSKYLQKIKDLSISFTKLDIQRISRSENAWTDALSYLATSNSTNLGWKIYIEHLDVPSIEEALSINQINNEPSWIDLLIEYLNNGTIPIDKKETRRIKQQVLWYIFLNGQLYKKLFSMPLLRCLRPSEVDYALQKVYEGIYRNHLGVDP